MRGNIAYELAFNQFGNFVWGLAYTPKTPELSDLRRRAHFLDAHGRIAALANSRAEMVEVTYSDPEQGYEVLYAYLDRDGQPQPGRDLAYKLRQPVNEQGLPATLISLDKNDRLMNDAFGNAEMRSEYDALGNVVRAEAFDRHGYKVTVSQGYQRAEFAYDDAGNLKEMRYFNARGGPALEKESGAHRIVREYTPEGYLKSEAYYGTSDEPVRHSISDYHRFSYMDFDGSGNPHSMHFYGIYGEASTDNVGCHAYSYKYNEYGQPVEYRCFDLADSPAKDGSGVHLTRTTYDDHGNDVEYSYFDVGGSKVENNDGYRRVNITRGKRGNITERALW